MRCIMIKECLFVFIYFLVLLLFDFDFCFFFFSSRRRHTRWNCDWSSDVYSWDLFTSSALASPRRTRVARAVVPSAQIPRIQISCFMWNDSWPPGTRAPRGLRGTEIGRASCRERV